MRHRTITLMLFFAGLTVAARADSLQSGPDQVPLLELYTSEGCSSCPAADQMVSELKDSPDLWTKVIPVAFHVDYWDNLGWKDRMASPEFSERQRDYVRLCGSSSPYTPMLVHNGKELRRGTVSGKPDQNVGYLKVQQSPTGDFQVTFTPSSRYAKLYWQLDVALLGFDIVSKVSAGENIGKTLHHDFAVLDHQSKEAFLSDGVVQASFEIDLHPSALGRRLGLVAWVHQQGDLPPVQAVGGYLSMK